jgi:O-antigen/teichoic acid export membrane protein
MIGYSQLGYYTIALMSIQQINSLGRFSQIILLPHIQEKYGKTKDIADAKPLFVKSTETLIYILPVIIALVFFGVPVVVYYFLPKFAMGLVSMRILVTAYYFVAVNEMSSSILLTINKQARQIPIFAVMILMAIGLNYLFIQTKGGIEGVALATTISYFIYFIFFYYYAFKHIMGKPELHRSILNVVGIFIYMAFLLYGTEGLCHLASPFVECVAKFLIFLLLFSPVLIIYEKKEGVLKTIVSIVCDKWKGAFRATTP